MRDADSQAQTVTDDETSVGGAGGYEPPAG
jgi:hypothetical protein